jgi:hypothetical protein
MEHTGARTSSGFSLLIATSPISLFKRVTRDPENSRTQAGHRLGDPPYRPLR